uniref:Ankyrin 3 n=1 Tax=Salmo trutta TaxID=8032 RepID=A0A674EC71_SALTR
MASTSGDHRDPQIDSNASYLRAARAGNLEKALDYLKTGVEINICNQNGLNALHLASKEGHAEVVTHLIKLGANVDAATKKGNTALHIASLAGQVDVVKELVTSGANINAQSQNGFTPLYMAAQENHQKVVRYLLDHGSTQGIATEDGFTPLAVALQQGHEQVVSLLLENDTKGKVRLPALHIAARKDDTKAVALLLQIDHNADVESKMMVNRTTESGFTPLHIAAHYGNINVATLLLNRGAAVDFKARNDITPLHVASKRGNGNMVKVLLERGGKIDARTKDGLTPLHCGARSGHEQVLEMLLDRGAPILSKTKNGLSPLHMATQGDHLNCVQLLLHHEVPVDDVTNDYLTALHVAAHCGHYKVAKVIVDKKANPNAKALNGFTPLHIACKKNRVKVMELLLKHGASIQAVTESGLTPIHVAAFMGHDNIVTQLTNHGASPNTTNVVKQRTDTGYKHTQNRTDTGYKHTQNRTDTGYKHTQNRSDTGYKHTQNRGQIRDRYSLRSFSSDRSNTLNRTSYTRDSMMIEEILAPTKDMNLAVASRDCDSDSLRHYSWTADTMDNINMVSSPVHSGFLVSFMVDARGGSMRGSRHNGMRIIIPPRKCTAPTRITCRLAKRHKLATPPPMVDGEGLASRLVEVGPAGAQFLGPVIVEIPHFGSMRGKERELIMLRSENGETWKEHQYDCKTDDLNELLNGMDEELDSAKELEKKRICRIITKDFPQYFAVVSRIRQESSQMGPEGGVLSSLTLPLVQASFPEGALTKKIRVGLQAQPAPDDMVKKILGNRATFSPIVTVEPRRRKFHKPITMTIPVPPLSGEGVSNGYKGHSTPCLRLLCSITGGTSPAQWEDITGTTPLTFVNDCVSFTTNVSARFWLADCHQIPETVGLATQLYRELICVPYMAKFVVFAKMNDPMESRLRCFCMTDDKVDKTLEQQENFEEVARSKDIEVLEGRPIYVDCYGNLAPLAKAGQLLVLNFYAFKENRLPFCVKVRDNSQEPCGRLTFLKETAKTAKGFPQTAVCNLNITLPALKKEMESDPDEETEKPERRHTFTSLALRKRYSYLAEPATSPQSPCERTDLRMAIVADHLGLSWTELAREMDFSVDEINHIRVDNPNSLTAQSFMLLKKWVSRDGKNATTDSLTEVLTKINRMDIVTLLEGPIFDYGNISGTRCFADDNAVTLDQCNGSSSIQLELQTPTGLICQPPTPLSSDHFFDEDAGLDSPSRTPTRPCDLSLTQTTSTPGLAPHAQPPTMVVEEDTSGPLDSQGPGEGAGEGSGEGAGEGAREGPGEGPKVTSTEDDTGVSRESVASYKPHGREAGVREEADQDVDKGMPIRQIDLPQGVVREDEWLAGARGDPSETLGFRPALGGEGGVSGSPGEEEEEGEMSEEKLKSLLEEMALEEGSEDEDMTEDRINAILSQVQQADKDVMSSPAGWHSETSSVNVEPPTPGRSLSAEGNDLQDTR